MPQKCLNVPVTFWYAPCGKFTPFIEKRNLDYFGFPVSPQDVS